MALICAWTGRTITGRGVALSTTGGQIVVDEEVLQGNAGHALDLIQGLTDQLAALAARVTELETPEAPEPEPEEPPAALAKTTTRSTAKKAAAGG